MFFQYIYKMGDGMSGMSDGIQDFFLADISYICHFIGHKSGTDTVYSLLIINLDSSYHSNHESLA